MPTEHITGITDAARPTRSPDPRLGELEGLIPTEVGLCLWYWASLTPADLAIVEIGSYKGKSTCYLADGAGVKGPMVYAIDAWGLEGNVPGRFHFDNARRDFDTQVEKMGFRSRITAINGFGAHIGSIWKHYQWAMPVGLLFVDGDHHEESVLEDVMAWLPNMSERGVIVLDDYNTPRNPGVAKAADKLTTELGKYKVYAERLAAFQL